MKKVKILSIIEEYCPSNPMGVVKFTTTLVQAFLSPSGLIIGVALISVSTPFAYKRLDTTSQTFLKGLNIAS